ncbi:hypothetical protein [Mycolicibacterium obuense]|uniref:hypothetical protein n=1 Tax=Mycolicibacterium obuense TaxID=1807 RepID=UPI0023F9DD2E|nr:hypothetical protein [Mycolicibacterium obuense]
MITTTGLTVVALPTVPAAVGTVTRSGATATGALRTVTTVVAGTLVLPWSSVTEKLTVNNPASLDVSVIDCNSCAYASTEAAPVNVIEPAPDVAVTPTGSAPYDSEPDEADTVAAVTLVESMSEMTTVGLTVIALPLTPAAVGAVTTNGAAAKARPRRVTMVVASALVFP